jgi:hypothetical protein
MNRTFQIYIEGQRLELFKDENISVNSSVQNISDISKVFTDFSQSFTVPASTHNNIIFQHFYNSDFDGNVDHRLRRNAFIEIDFIPFRTGKIQLEKANMKKGKVDNYTITFYGDVRSLKDKIGEDKLASLDMSEYTHPYLGSEIEDRVIGTLPDYDVYYPLISSKRVWQYNNITTPSDNIDTVGGAIRYDELFPAIKIDCILKVIEGTYGVNFIGTFRNTNKFQRAFLYLKNRAENTFLSDGQRIDFSSVVFTDPASTAWTSVDLVNDTFRYHDMPLIEILAGQWSSGVPHKTTISILGVSSPSVTYYIDVYINNTLSTTIVGSGNNTYTAINDFNNPIIDNTVYFIIRAASPLTFSSQTRIFFEMFGFPISEIIITGATQTATSNIDLATNMPDMKITDFFTGILNEFNLTCYGVSENVFELEPLEDWYSKGYIHDITQYTDVDEITIERIKLYKSIKFSHQKSESFMNRQFAEFFGREYGSLDYQYPYDGAEYNIQLPFEQLLFNKFSGTNIQVGYCLTKGPDFKPYVPKPIILYKDIIQNTFSDFYFYDGINYISESQYVTFGQDLFISPNYYTLNFGADISTMLLEPIDRSLFQEYYYDYLISLFSNKNRLVYVKAVLPLSIITNLKLNDRLIIRDKRYIINDMKIELRSGVCDFTLLNDFAPVRRRITVEPIRMERGFEGISLIELEVLVPNNARNVSFDTRETPLLFSDLVVEQDKIITVTAPENTSRVDVQYEVIMTINFPQKEKTEVYTIIFNQLGNA